MHLDDVDFRCLSIPNFRTELGEGLLWDDREQLLLMTDIIGQKLVVVDLKNLTQESFSFEEEVCWILMTNRRGVYLVGLGSGVIVFDTFKAKIQSRLDYSFPKERFNRLNDACVGPDGRVWLGSMHRHSQNMKTGRLASFKLDEGLKQHDFNFQITNGPIVTPNGLFLYVNDSAARVMYRYQMNATSDGVTRREIFVKFSQEQGLPDGMCFDSEGHIWVAMWGAGAVIKLDQTGTIKAEYRLPAVNVTNVCFAGDLFDRLIVSSASILADEYVAEKNYGAGQLIEIIGHKSYGIKQCQAQIPR
ncbi:MAG: SMP-30/gluconolactonase/LRE family protein [Betaproteobacteria bacterium]|nr:SMP-30/gluconolactonase/LRE family protein [Betaproteobacteria bacterium]